ncbi:hypothetical protein DMT42_25950 [Streptomyces actuosus]|uniref:Uncharacterized protein n=1 Tax=Streptomyces actuosus TaxID=1885 RepID=A0A2U9P839_STRAS|nr:hypothetical protein DMT42_25950 [Streptomyces actuosus]
MRVAGAGALVRPGARGVCCVVPGVAVARGWVARSGACGVPLRPPVPPQRHDCPQLRQRGDVGRPAAQLVLTAWWVFRAPLCRFAHP